MSDSTPPQEPTLHSLILALESSARCAHQHAHTGNLPALHLFLDSIERDAAKARAIVRAQIDAAKQPPTL